MPVPALTPALSHVREREPVVFCKCVHHGIVAPQQSLAQEVGEGLE